MSRLSPHRLKDLPPIIHASPIPAANNVMVSSSPLANVKSIGQMIDRDRAAAGNSDSKSCGYCSYELAIAAVNTCSATTVQISVCAHLMVSSWPSVCGSLPVPSREDDDGVEAMSLDE